MKSLFVKFMGDGWKIKILDYLIGNCLFDFTKKDIIKETKISKEKANEYFIQLMKQGFLYKMKRAGKFYRVNKNSNFAKDLIKLDWIIIKNNYL